jgi:hypothetical protein
MATQRQLRIEQGVCGNARCGRARVNATECRRCARRRSRKQAARLARLRAERDRQGRCLECGGRRDGPGKLCKIDRILEQQRGKRYRLKATA